MLDVDLSTGILTLGPRPPLLQQFLAAGQLDQKTSLLVDLNVSGPPGLPWGRCFSRVYPTGSGSALTTPTGSQFSAMLCASLPVDRVLLALLAHSPARPLKQPAGIQDAAHNPQPVRKEGKGQCPPQE